MSDGSRPTVDGQRLGGIETRWENAVNQPVPERPRRTVDVAGLAEFTVIVLGLSLVVVGFWASLGWSWGLVALGAALLVAVKWADRGGVR